MGTSSPPDTDPSKGLGRRQFLKYAGATGALAAASQSLPALTRSAGATTVRALVGRFQLEEATIAQLQAAMTAGTLTSVQLTQAYLDRIDEIDHHGIRLNSVIETNPDAIAIAHKLDVERQHGHFRGPLHGIPILLKDNIATRDKMQSTAGSWALFGSVVPRDAFVASQLRNAGAVLLGKANLSEWANFRSFQSSSGWSGRAGQCLDPYVLDHNPCGSSSGSGAAVAANLAAASLGTETDGSIVCPSSNNCLVGIKVTRGLTSRSGVVPIAHSQDVVGPMARTVADAATVLGALTGVDPLDPVTKKSRGHAFTDYTQFLDPNGLKGARIGVWREGVFGFSPEADQIAEVAIGQMSSLGATIIDPADIPHMEDVFGPEFVVLLFEFKVQLTQYLQDLVSSQVRSLEQCIKFNSAHPGAEMPWFGQEIFLLAQTTDGLNDPAYAKARTKAHAIAKEAVDSTFAKHDLDAIVSITDSPPWTIDLVNGDHFVTGSSTAAAVNGYPSIAVPAGFAYGELPVGMSFIGRAWDEPKLIRLTSGFEAGTKVRHAPRFLHSLGLKDFVPRGSSMRAGGPGTGSGPVTAASPRREVPRAWPI
jgi:amidase